ncbi:MAG: hypothetical protein KUL81_14705 [Azonexus sp.]|nr:hypothetical protein [Azonexus sp.]
MPSSIDINGSPVAVGSTVRLPSLSGQWLENLPAEERSDVMSMVGEIFVVEEIDDYGHPWVRKSWPNEAEGKGHSHSVALEQHEMEVVQSAL